MIRQLRYRWANENTLKSTAKFTTPTSAKLAALSEIARLCQASRKRWVRPTGGGVAIMAPRLALHCQIFTQAARARQFHLGPGYLSDRPAGEKTHKLGYNSSSGGASPAA